MTAPHPSPERSAPAPAGTGALSLFWLLMSLGMLFLTTLVTLWVARGALTRDEMEVRPGGMPDAVWLATGIVVLLSALVERAARRGRRGERPTGLLWLASAAALLFLGLQAANWVAMWSSGFGAASGLYAFGFFVLTGLHGAHVLGGVGYQWMVTRRAARGEAPAQLAPRLRGNAVYWHFLLVTWLLILGTIHGTATESGPLVVGRFFLGVTWVSLVAGVVCWLITVRLIWVKDGPLLGALGIFPLFSVVFGWVRFQEHDNLRVMVAWQIAIAAGLLGYIMKSTLLLQ